MKKISTLLIKLAAGFTILLALFSFNFSTAKTAQAACETGFHPASSGSPICLPDQQVKGGFADKTTIGSFLLQVIQILLLLSAVVAILFIVIGGFMYMTSSGNQEQADKGKKMITNAIIGLIVIILSYTIISIVINTVTTGNVLGTGGTGGSGGGNGGGQNCTITPDGSRVCN